jgi:superkiller protein 3
LLLPGSALYPTLFSLPPPDPTTPTASTILPIQISVHNSLPTLEEVVALIESEEEEAIEREIQRRRMRLDFADSGVDSLRKSVGLQFQLNSKVRDLASNQAALYFIPFCSFASRITC